MDSNCKNKFHIDHVYCHPNEAKYIRANAGSSDVLSILKENKQLKAMLLLHLDLIQEQSDQLVAKDKLLANLREENETLKLRIERMDRRVQSNKVPKTVEQAPPMLVQSNNYEEKKENIPEEIVSQAVSPIANMVAPIVVTSKSAESKYKICDDTFTNDSIIGENNGKFISKIILQRVQPSDQQPASNSANEDENNTELLNEKNIEAKDDESSSQYCLSQPEEVHDTEDSFSCGSGEHDPVVQYPKEPRKRIRRIGMMTTKTDYSTREWEAEQDDEEINLEESDALKSEQPNLEIPKWTIKDFTGLYSIEGTEDLSDEIFTKRHAKLEYSEKRRKKWDVQRIREQRTIERLKKRHYKVEIQETDNQDLTSFYPTLDSLKFIQITEEIPVQAFGEPIPEITPNEFSLPWNFIGSIPPVMVSPPPSITPAASTSFALVSSAPQTTITENTPSSYVLLKKRRLHSTSNTNQASPIKRSAGKRTHPVK